MFSLWEQIRGVAEKRLESADRCREQSYGCKDIWPTYSRDAWSYFEGFSEISDLVKAYFRDHKGDTINYLDVAGSASFSGWGSKKFREYAFERESKEKGNLNIIEGDIMDDGSFESLVAKIKKDQSLLDIVTFRPVGALMEYAPEDHLANEDYGISEINVPGVSKEAIEFRLLKVFVRRLQSIHKILKPGGLLFLGKSDLLNRYYLEFGEKVFEPLFRKLGFEVVRSSVSNQKSIRGGVPTKAYLLRKNINT